jgi:hypothetical protein
VYGMVNQSGAAECYNVNCIEQVCAVTGPLAHHFAWSCLMIIKITRNERISCGSDVLIVE